MIAARLAEPLPSMTCSTADKFPPGFLWTTLVTSRRRSGANFRAAAGVYENERAQERARAANEDLSHLERGKRTDRR